MPRKKNSVLRRARALMACHFTSISRNLLLFKRTNKRFSLISHYNYGYIGEYEFSPSDTPVFRLPWRPVPKKRKRFMSLLLCGGNAAESSVDGGWGDELEVLSIARDQSEALDWEEDEASIDRRAERFIQRFYEEIRIQRRRSL
ncbi:uncharacterized protein A4U43_C01F31800 [Asparagus officinalis]|uniref:Cotton fiber protein n=1 Tax=Asparagus officinalis TaxID=4686 RepID=A0A5P1FUB0_ASPOF|nr:uncharacterized protein LOC109844358 [Asparagus officinalis]ONK81682.1 uncharacterized protein A4U43_C01F31800 [Asparagus officinalis]